MPALSSSNMPRRFRVFAYERLCLGPPLGAIDEKTEVSLFLLADGSTLVIVEVSDIHSSILSG